MNFFFHDLRDMRHFQSDISCIQKLREILSLEHFHCIPTTDDILKIIKKNLNNFLNAEWNINGIIFSKKDLFL